MPSLLSLPPELFSAVLDGISGRDVMNLRLVCRHTSALSNHHFGLKCLTDLSFIWSPYSLQGLLDMSVHPLGRYIKRLSFATNFIYAEKLTENPDEQREARLRTIFEQWDERNELVVRALKNLQKLNVQPLLGVFDVPWDPFNFRNNRNRDAGRYGYGYEKFYGNSEPDEASGDAIDRGEGSHPSFVHAVDYVLKAAQRVELPVRGFHVHWEASTNHEQQDDLRTLRRQYLVSGPGELKPDFEFLATVFDKGNERDGNFKSKVYINTKRQSYEFSKLPSEGMAWLTHYRASFDWGQTFLQHPLDNNLEAFHHCFREIRIALCSTTVDFLTAFLTSQARSLRVLRLEHITMNLYDDPMVGFEDVIPTDEALEFLRMLKDDLALDYLKMTRLNSAMDRSRLIGGHDDTWTSREEIQEGLQMYIQREENDEHSVDEEWSDDEEGEWISVHHSENEDEDEEEVWPGTSQNEDGVTTEQPAVEEEEGAEA
ncbi:hypothetical protein KCU99_g8445, partial [Aureobasidium melanogenum]